MTHPFRDPKSQSEAASTFILQTMQASSGQQVCLLQKRALIAPFASSNTVHTPPCPTLTLARVVVK